MSLATDLLKSIKENLEKVGLKFNELLPPVAPTVPVALTEHTLADGTVISIDKVAVDGLATINGAPADGDFELPDGTKIKVVAGVITEVEMKQQEVPISEAMFTAHKAEMEAKFTALTAVLNEVLNVSKEQFSLVEEISKEPIVKPLEKGTKIDFSQIPFEKLTAYQKRQLAKEEA